ncbi:MAG: hypothetical protein IKH51_11740 [Clostridia bacterium]|nr:hypothetical protein [Clostridia bacterium]
MNKYDLRKKEWYIATAVGVFVFPVGFIWNVINTVIDYKRNIKKNNAVLYSAIGATIFGLFMSGYVLFVSLGMNDTEGTAMFLMYMYAPTIVLAVYLYAVYFISAHRCKYLSRIYSLIELDHITSVPLMSEILGINRARTRRYIKKLGKMRYLKDVKIDEKTGDIILKECIWAKQRVICQNCGAEITVTFGQTLVCEYCGGALMVKRVHNEPLENG